MGQVCGPGAPCDLTFSGRGNREQEYAFGSHYDMGQRDWDTAASIQNLHPDEVSRKVSQLSLELRMLRDDNYRIREEQLVLESQLKEAALQADRPGQRGRVASMRASDPRIDNSGQLLYMQEAIRNLQAENTQLRNGASGYSQGGVSEAEYRELQRRLKSLQQSHLWQLQQARQLQGRGGSAAASRAGSALASGAATPVSSTPFWSGQESRLQAQYEALMREQEALRGKVRMLARDS